MSNRAVTILAGATLLLGVLIGRASANTGGGSNKPKASTAATPGLDPKSYPRTKQGAATAAQAYNDALFRASLKTPDQRRAVIEAISTDAMRDQIDKDEDQGAAVAAKVFDLPKDEGQVVGRITPLGYRVVTFTKDSARVEIWTLTLLGKSGVGHGIPPQFSTATVDLAWERGAWRVAGSPQTKDGPTPLGDSPQASSDLLNATKDLQEFSYAAR